MTNKEYQNFLIKIAKETDELFKVNDRKVTKQIKEFIKRFENWEEKVFEGQREALKDPKLQGWKDRSSDERLKGVPQNYILYDPNNFYGQEYALDGIKGPYWAAELPSNPVDTLRRRDILSILLPDYCEDNYPLYERNPLDTEEDLLRKYFLLAVIHAHRSHSSPLWNCDSESDEPEPVRLVWDMYRSLDKAQLYCWETTIKEFIETALNDIKADLKPPETEQKATAEHEKDNWFYRLYRITITSFWYTFWDKVLRR